MAAEDNGLEGEGVISGSAEDVRASAEVLLVIGSETIVEEMVPGTEDSEEGGVISGWMEDVREPVEITWDVGVEGEGEGVISDCPGDT